MEAQTGNPAASTGRPLGGMAIDAYKASLGMTKEKDFFECDRQYMSKNYAPVPVVISRGQGAFVWDIDNKMYFDFLSGVSVGLHVYWRLFSV